MLDRLAHPDRSGRRRNRCRDQKDRQDRRACLENAGRTGLMVYLGGTANRSWARLDRPDRKAQPDAKDRPDHRGRWASAANLDCTAKTARASSDQPDRRGQSGNVAASA